METGAKITANKEGKVFTPNAELGKDGKEYGFIRVESQRIDWNGPLAKVTRVSALKSMLKSDFEKAKDVLIAGVVIPGKIIITESLEKIGNAQPKKAGSEEDAQVCTLDDQPIYRYTSFTSDMSKQDTLIKHNNVIVAKKVQQVAEKGLAG